MFHKADLAEPAAEFTDRLEKKLKPMIHAPDKPATPRKRLLSAWLVPNLAAAAAVAAVLLLAIHFGTGRKPEMPLLPADPGNIQDSEDPRPAPRPAPPAEMEGKVVSFDFHDQMSRGRERIWSLMEKVEKADAILAGRFLEGGGANRFELLKVLKGDDLPEVVHLITGDGRMVCPRPADPVEGAWAVAFAFTKRGFLTIGSSQWLMQFRSQKEFLDLVMKIETMTGGTAVPGLLARLMELAREEAENTKTIPPAAGDGDWKKVMSDLMRIRREFGQKSREEYMEAVRQYFQDHPRAREIMERHQRDDRASDEEIAQIERKSELRRLVKDIELVGGAHAAAGLMEVHLAVRPTEANAAILLALGRMDLSAKGGGESVLEILSRVNRRLGDPVMLDPGASGKELHRALKGLRDAILRRAALGETGAKEHQVTALESMVKGHTQLLDEAEVVRIIADRQTPPPARFRAVQLARQRQLASAAEPIADMVVALDPAGSAGSAEQCYGFASVSLYSLYVEGVEALAAIDDPATAPRLIEQLGRPFPEGSDPRHYVAKALADMGVRDALPLLESLLAENPGMENHAKNMIERAIKKLRR